MKLKDYIKENNLCTGSAQVVQVLLNPFRPVPCPVCGRSFTPSSQFVKYITIPDHTPERSKQ